MSRLVAPFLSVVLAVSPIVAAQTAPQQFNPCNPKIQKCA